MMSKKVVTIIGARPQFIKACIVSKVMSSRSNINEVLIHTGQHYENNMSDIFFNELGIKKPSYTLGINGGSHGSMTGRMLEAIEAVLVSENPDIVLVYGDTNSTLAGSLAAAKLGMPIAHVEAGLRSFNMNMPEEINRVTTDRLSKWLFTPTSAATKNLIREGFSSDDIFQVGDVMFDVVKHFEIDTASSEEILHKYNLIKRRYILATIHRQENTDDLARLKTIIDAFLDTSRDIQIVWPIHPRTRKIMINNGWFEQVKKSMTILEPVGFFEMAHLQKYSCLIATDSGGVQKEAYFYKVPCITLRDETEWHELIETGWNRLVPPKSAVSIERAIRNSLGILGEEVVLYGQGNASELIVDTLVRY